MSYYWVPKNLNDFYEDGKTTIYICEQTLKEVIKDYSNIHSGVGKIIRY